MRLDGKIALLTGAGTSIGRVISIRFPTEGAKVAMERWWIDCQVTER